jgi:hypothetical protein
VNKAKADPKTVQSLLRPSKIQTTLDLYTQGDSDETRSAQGAVPECRGPHPEGAVMLWVELRVGIFAAIPFQLTEKNGGDDGTRTRGLCRDSPAFLGFTTTYKNREDCQSSRKSF